MIFSSNRFVLDLDEDKVNHVAHLANEREISPSQAVNDALDAYVGKANKKEKDALAEAGIGGEEK